MTLQKRELSILKRVQHLLLTEKIIENLEYFSSKRLPRKACPSVRPSTPRLDNGYWDLNWLLYPQALLQQSQPTAPQVPQLQQPPPLLPLPPPPQLRLPIVNHLAVVVIIIRWANKIIATQMVEVVLANNNNNTTVVVTTDQAQSPTTTIVGKVLSSIIHPISTINKYHHLMLQTFPLKVWLPCLISLFVLYL